MFRNIAAYTVSTGNYPEYVSINENENTGKIHVSVRSPKIDFETPGTVSEIILTKEEFKIVFYDALGNISTPEDYFI